MNCKLFDRLGRSIVPTVQADILYPKALAILEDISKLKDELALAGKNVSGELVIGASTIPGAYILPAIASSFKTTYPGVSFEIRIDDSARIVKAIAANELLIGVVGAKIPARKINYEPFGEDELILVAAGDSTLAGSIAPEALVELPFLLREEGSGTRKNIETFLADRHITTSQLQISAILGSSTAIKEAVKAGLGVSILSRHALHDELLAGSVREIAVQGMPLRRSFYIATAAKRSLPNHYQVFIRALAQAGQVLATSD